MVINNIASGIASTFVVKTVGRITYIVLVQTLNPAQSDFRCESASCSGDTTICCVVS